MSKSDVNVIVEIYMMITPLFVVLILTQNFYFSFKTKFVEVFNFAFCFENGPLSFLEQLLAFTIIQMSKFFTRIENIEYLISFKSQNIGVRLRFPKC